MWWGFNDFVNYKICNLRNLFLEVWKLAQMYHFMSWVFRVTRKEFTQIVYLTKES